MLGGVALTNAAAAPEAALAEARWIEAMRWQSQLYLSHHHVAETGEPRSPECLFIAWSGVHACVRAFVLAGVRAGGGASSAPAGGGRAPEMRPLHPLC
eukprot:3326396-Pleurochrysis_carterae.AAC.5